MWEISKGVYSQTETQECVMLFLEDTAGQKKTNRSEQICSQSHGSHADWLQRVFCCLYEKHKQNLSHDSDRELKCSVFRARPLSGNDLHVLTADLSRKKKHAAFRRSEK